MKLLQFLPLAALAAAFVVPDERVFNNIAVDTRDKNKANDPIACSLPFNSQGFLGTPFEEATESDVNTLDDALAYIDDQIGLLPDDLDDAAYPVQSWLEPGFETGFEAFNWPPHLPHPPWHGKKPHHGRPCRGKRPPKHPKRPPKHPKRPPHHRPGKHPPFHPPHHRYESNKTILQMISESNYTTKLAKLVSEYDDLVSLLNSTKDNYTLFAPIDAAFNKLPDIHKPSKELIKKVLQYHITPEAYPAGRLLFSKTVPTLHHEACLGGEPQRIAARISLKGMTLNFYARPVAVNIHAKNGIIHGLGELLIPPPPTPKILSLLPSEFSTLVLGLEKTGLFKTLEDMPRAGGTLFAPSNFAFKKLGPKINAFLFSKWGEKYLKASLSYHIVVNQTLYQTAFYNGTGKGSTDVLSEPVWLADEVEPGFGVETLPYLHFDLPTLLHGRTLNVDIGRRGPFVTMRVNGFVMVVVPDGVAKDGVINVVNTVLIPPKTVPGTDEVSFWDGEEMTVEEFMERMEPLVEEEDASDSDSDSDSESSDDEEGEFKVLPVEEDWEDL